MADQNKIRYGFKNVYYALKHVEDGVVTYGTPKPWKGAVSFTGDAETEESKIYADDTVYFATNTNNGRSGQLEMKYIPDEVLKDIFNYVESEDGILLEDAYALPNAIALLYECQGDANATRHIYYDVTLSAPSTSENTKEEAVDAQNQSCNYTAIPLPTSDGKYALVTGKVNVGTPKYDTFFTTAPAVPVVKTSGM